MATTSANQPMQKLPENSALSQKLRNILSQNNALLHWDSAAYGSTSQPDSSAEFVEALTALSETFCQPGDWQGTGTEETRRELQNRLEMERVRCNREILNAFQLVTQELEIVEKDIVELDKQCNSMQQRLRQVHQQASRLISESSRLRSEKEDLSIKKNITRAFLDRFVLSEEEIDFLTSDYSDTEISPIFFAALRRLQTLQNDCKLLLLADRNQAGLDIMESVTMLQDAAYDRLFKWIQIVTKALSREVPEITSTMRQVMIALKHRSVLLHTVVDDIVSVRRNTVVRTFVDALQHGGPGGNPRPIEVYAHDPIRYIGDMLAWIHQAACSERETLDQLLDEVDEQQKNIDVASRDPTAEIIDMMLDRILEGICRPLRLRIDQVFSSRHTTVLAYKIANMIQFYARLIEKAMVSRTRKVKTTEKDNQHRAILLRYLDDITQSAFKLLFDVIDQQATYLLKTTQEIGADLEPPTAFKDAVNELKDLMASQDASLVQPLSPVQDSYGCIFQVATDRESSFAPVLTSVVDPLVQTCTAWSEQLSHSFSQSIFMVNCLYEILIALQLYSSFTKRSYELIEAQVEVHLELIVEEEVQSLLQKSGLNSLLKAMDAAEGMPDHPPLSTYPGLDGHTVHTILSGAFDALLCSINMEISTDLSLLLSSRYVKLVSKKCVEKVVDAYRRIYTALLDPKNQFINPQTEVAIRSVEEVETVMGVSTAAQ